MFDLSETNDYDLDIRVTKLKKFFPSSVYAELVEEL